MDTDEAAAALARTERGAMRAAAGCGKTRVISTAVACHGRGRNLVLTHTHAGVDALRRRLTQLGVPTKAYELQTIAGWALRLASSFPRTAELSNSTPRTNDDYTAIYRGARAVVGLKPIQKILRASYSSTYVDEYQDCTLEQHNLMVALSAVLPCRVVGDPLQGIFGFRKNPVVEWERHVAPAFDDVPGPTVDWRWKNSNPELGVWLQDVRVKLMAGDGIDLGNAPIRWFKADTSTARRTSQFRACFDAASMNGDSVVAIHRWPNQCHDVASKLKGRYSCVESIDVPDLYQFAERIGSANGLARAVAVLDFAGKCMTCIKTELKTIRKALASGRVPTVRKYEAQLAALLKVSDGDGLRAIPAALDMLGNVKGVVVYRRELLHEMQRAVRACAAGEVPNMNDAAWIVRSRTRRIGRRLSRCVVGTTLLVKGLEFDHAVVLDADGYDAKNLYVAFTRGARSLTIVSRASFLQPGRGGNAESFDSDDPAHRAEGNEDGDRND